MNFEQVYGEFKEYASRRHKKQGFVTICQDFEKHVLPYFKNRNVESLTKKDVLNWQNNILDFDFSNQYNSILYYVFNSFFEYCVNCSYVDENYVSSVGTFTKKIEHKEHNVYTIWQFRRFRHFLDENIYKQYFNFMYFYGTRPSECMALRFCDLEKGFVHINHSICRKGDRKLDTPKNQSSIRVIKISLLMRFRIWRLKRFYQKNFDFSNDYYIFGGFKPLAPTTIDRRKSCACIKAKLKPITQHEFRHSYATRMIHKRRVPIDYVSRSLGHSKVSTTLDIYLHQEKNTLNVFSR